MRGEAMLEDYSGNTIADLIEAALKLIYRNLDYEMLPFG